MKSLKRRGISWLLILTMVFTTMFSSTAMAFADTTGGPEPELPNAKVNDLGKIIIPEYHIYNGSGFSNGGDPIDLQIALQFLANDTPEQAANHPYGQHTTDFFIKIDGMTDEAFVADEDCYLAGNYGFFGWIMIPLQGMEIVNGKIYPVITSVGFDFTYEMICTDVKDFKCGIHLSDAVLKKNPDLNVTLELGLSESLEVAQNASYTKVDSFSYDVKDLKDAVTVDNEIINSIVSENNVYKEDVTNIVTDIINNAAMKQHEPDLQGKAVRLDVVLSDMTVSTEEEGVVPASITYDVTPKDKNDQKVEAFEEKVNFRLPVPDSVTQVCAKVYHEDELMGIFQIQGEMGERYVEVSSARFSEYKLVFASNENFVAKIGDGNFEKLQDAINAAQEGDNEIVLLGPVTENVRINQKEGVNIVIDGGNNVFTGVMEVFGGDVTRTETLKIRKVVFQAVRTQEACILSPDRTDQNPNAYSYAHNVTVEDCQFRGDKEAEAKKTAAIRHKDGNNPNWTITGCTVDEYMHSLLQVNNVTGKLIIKDCEVNSKNGVNLNYTEKVEMTGCTFDVTGYALRAGVDNTNPGDARKEYELRDNVLKSKCDGGDAVIVLRDSSVNMDLNMEKNALQGSIHLDGVTGDTIVNANANYWDGQNLPVVSVGTNKIVVETYYEDAAMEKLNRNCGIDTITHTFENSEWMHDGTSHWRVCLCGEKETAAGHTWGEYVDENNASCEKDGTKVRECAVCDREDRVDVVGSGGHQWDEGVVTTEPACEKAGVKTFTCQRDKNHTKTEAVAALEHDFKWQVMKEATVEEEGLKKEICGLCGGEGQEEKIPCLKAPETNKPVTDEPTVEEPPVLEEGVGHLIDEITTPYVQGSDEGLSLRGDGEIDNFKAVKVDGEIVDEQYYTVTEGSTIVTFTAEYLDSLEPGTHEVEMIWTTGSAFAEIEIEEETTVTPDTPDDEDDNGDGDEDTQKPDGDRDGDDEAVETGDQNMLYLWLVTALTAIAACAICFFVWRKKTEK